MSQQQERERQAVSEAQVRLVNMPLTDSHRALIEACAAAGLQPQSIEIIVRDQPPDWDGLVNEHVITNTAVQLLGVRSIDIGGVDAALASRAEEILAQQKREGEIFALRPQALTPGDRQVIASLRSSRPNATAEEFVAALNQADRASRAAPLPPASVP